MLYRREAVIVFLLLALGIVTRVYFGVFRPTGDLDFYISLDQFQQTRFGLDKRLGFYPLGLLESEQLRTLVLASIMALLNLLAVKRLWGRSGARIGFLALIIGSSNYYFAQIDMHLVRQQIALYFFVFMITERNLGFSAFLWAAVSVFYHEIALLLFLGWGYSWCVAKYNLIRVRFLFWFASTVALAVIYLELKSPSVLFLVYTLVGFFIVKKEASGLSIGDSLAFMIVALLGLWLAGIMTPVGTIRTIGVLVSLGLLRLMYDGRFQLREGMLKRIGLLVTLSMYGVASLV